MNTRDTIISAGEHIHAVRRLGADYEVEAYLEANDDARAVNAGERYADSVLGPETITATTEPDPNGAALHEAALGILKDKGKNDNYSQAEYLEACKQALAESSLEARRSSAVLIAPRPSRSARSSASLPSSCWRSALMRKRSRAGSKS
jgi:hypothetical protein